MPALIAGIILTIIFANDSSEEQIDSRNFNFTYDVKIPNIPENSKYVDVFVPLPKSDETQEISNLKIVSDADYTVETDPEYKNKILHVVLKDKIPDSISLEISFNVKRYLEDENKYSKDTNLFNRFLMPDSLVPIEGIVKEESEKVVTDKNLKEIEKAKLLFEHVVDTMVYDKKSNTGWGRGDILYACDARTGNCTDFHSLFIGLSRAQKIPSRFVIGFPIPEKRGEGKIAGYHCWAEFYSKQNGWVPVDASEAFKNPQKREFYFGKLDPNRVAFSMGRDIPLKTSSGKIKKANYLIYPYVLVNDKKFDFVKTEFRFHDLN